MATLLDELLIRVKTETADAEAGLKRTENQADKTGKSLASLATKALGAFTAALSVGKAIKSVMDTAADTHLFNQTANSIGVAVEEMDAFKRSMQDSGSTGEAAIGSLSGLFEKVGEAANNTTGEQAKMFGAMGISIKNSNGSMKDSVSIMSELAGAADRLDPAQATAYFKKLGITDQRVIETLLQGRKSLEATMRMHKELGGVTKESAEQAAKFDAAMNKLSHSQDRVGLSLMDMLLPAITWVVDKLGDMVGWLNTNKHFVVGFFGAIAAVIAAVYLPAMIAAAAATLAATWPLIAIGAAIAVVAAAFALVYDDIMNFIDGNDSFIGQIFDKYPMVKAIVFGIIDAFKQMGSALIAVFNMVLDGWKMVFDGIMSGVNAVKNGVGAVASFFGIGGKSSVEVAGAQLSSASASPMNSTTSAAISNSAGGGSETNVPIGQVTINTSSSTMTGAGADMADSLKGQLRDLDAQTATGVAR